MHQTDSTIFLPHDLAANKQENLCLARLTCTIQPVSSHIFSAQVHVDEEFVKKIYAATLNLFIRNYTNDFEIQSAPNGYIEETHHQQICNKTSDYILHFVVIDFLITYLREKQILVASYPRLKKVEFTPEFSLSFWFDLSTTDPIELKEWRNFSFKSPTRKRYKDLDRQVVTFIDKFGIKEKSCKASSVIEQGDWILFSATLVDTEKKPVTDQKPLLLWIKIKSEYPQDPIAGLFLGKKNGDSFITEQLNVGEHISELERKQHMFLLSVRSIAKGKYFSLDQFKTMFRLKNMNEAHAKLIEVFSFRNDISQRKAIIEEIFHLLLSKHRFQIPKHLILRREEDILHALSHQPDYHVYRAQEDFLDNVACLAEKQLKEEVLIDQIAHKENVYADERDVTCYLHLINHRRLRDFIYFRPHIEKLEDPEGPVLHSIISMAVLREKTLNHLIHILTH